MSIELPFRQVHLDFHTSIAIPDVGRNFDSDAFGDMVAEAHINSMTVFAKCHHGHLYYDTQRPERHPALPKKLDLLGEQIEALHRRGIMAPIYLSVQCDEYAANTHQDWIAQKPDGAPVRWGDSMFKPGWQIMDMSSPYADFLEEQIAEVCRKYKPHDGIFLDMCWDQPSCSHWATAAMDKLGLDPESETDRAAYAHQLVYRYMARYNKVISQFQGMKPPKVWYNSRQEWRFPEDKKYLQHIEIEALPTGGWGYTYFPLNVRYKRKSGLPMLGMTGRFHKSWADFGGLKPEAALLYECTQMLAHGARCSVGDQMHPRGTLDQAAYELIGKVYQHVEACEPFCQGARAVTQIAVLRPWGHQLKQGDALEGAVRLLQQLGHQFDFVAPEMNWDAYDLVLVPDNFVVDAPVAAKLKAYIKAGGAVLFSGPGGLTADGRPVLAEQGIVYHGPSPFTATYMRFDKADLGSLPATDHVMYDTGLRLTAGPGAQAIGKVVEPYFQRNWRHFSSHQQTPNDQPSRYALAAQKGRVITLAYPLLKAYATHANISFRHLLDVCLRRLIAEPLTTFRGPSHVEVTVLRQTGKTPRTIVHVLSFVPARRTDKLDIVEEPTPLVDVQVSLALPKAPKSVTFQPINQPADWEYRNGRAVVTFSSARGHDMIVFE